MSTPRIGLALGGGSARGLAHIPMLEVFDELGIKPAVIAGCSIGALIGAGYAAGMSARDIRERAERLLSNRIDAMRYVLGHKKMRLRDLLALKGIASFHIDGETLAGLVLPDDLPVMIEERRFGNIPVRRDHAPEIAFEQLAVSATGTKRARGRRPCVRRLKR